MRVPRRSRYPSGERGSSSDWRSCDEQGGSTERDSSISWGSASERGSATVTALATIAALMTVFVGLLLVAGVMVARGQAQTAADLAALAAARSLLDGGVAPCGRAAAVADANGAELVSCTVAGEEVVVAARAPVVWGGRITGLQASANARAGPEPPGS